MVVFIVHLFIFLVCIFKSNLSLVGILQLEWFFRVSSDNFLLCLSALDAVQ